MTPLPKKISEGVIGGPPRAWRYAASPDGTRRDIEDEDLGLSSYRDAIRQSGDALVRRPRAGVRIRTYRGRTTGRIYHTPINVFRRGDDYLFVLTYGSEVEWVKNVFAAGGCSLRTRGRSGELVRPELLVDPTRSLFSAARL